MTKQLTDDEIMAAALTCPESEKVPLKVGDRVIALENFFFWKYAPIIPKGDHGTVLDIDTINPPEEWPCRIKWDSHEGMGIWGILGPIGKLVPRRK